MIFALSLHFWLSKSCYYGNVENYKWTHDKAFAKKRVLFIMDIAGKDFLFVECSIQEGR